MRRRRELGHDTAALLMSATIAAMERGEQSLYDVPARIVVGWNAVRMSRWNELERRARRLRSHLSGGRVVERHELRVQPGDARVARDARRVHGLPARCCLGRRALQLPASDTASGRQCVRHLYAGFSVERNALRMRAADAGMGDFRRAMRAVPRGNCVGRATMRASALMAM